MAKVPLVNKPGVTNWVEKHNALPKGSWIRRAAEHLRGKGMPTGRAIATAVNAAKRMCATGDTNWPGLQQVNPGSRAQACAAVAAWTAARAKAAADTSIPAGERAAIELAFRRIDELCVELSWVAHGPEKVELAGAPRAGLVPTKVTVKRRNGTTYQRTMWLRPKQAKAMKAKKGGRKVSRQGADVARAGRGVLEALARVPGERRPKGWQDAVKALAVAQHGGRLGPTGRKALRDLQANAPNGSPLKVAVTAALKADAPKGEAKREQKRTTRRSQRRGARKGLKAFKARSGN